MVVDDDEELSQLTQSVSDEDPAGKDLDDNWMVWQGDRDGNLFGNVVRKVLEEVIIPDLTQTLAESHVTTAPATPERCPSPVNLPESPTAVVSQGLQFRSRSLGFPEPEEDKENFLPLVAVGPEEDKENKKDGVYTLKRPRPTKSPKLQRYFSFPGTTFLGIKKRKVVLDAEHSLIVPYKVGKNNIKFLDIENFLRLINGEFSDQVTVRVIDCRFPQEYQGGHIKGAINITSFDALHHLFEEDMRTVGRHITVFYCEFSSHRGPSMYEVYRRADRNEVAFQDWPKLHFPDLFVLEGGYEKFFQHQRGLCEPAEYLPMKDVPGNADMLSVFDKQYSKAIKCRSKAS